MTRPGRLSSSVVLLALTLVGILAGGLLWFAGEHDAANVAWAVTTAVGLVPIAWEVLSGIWRREAGVDLIALLAMAARSRSRSSSPGR